MSKVKQVHRPGGGTICLGSLDPIDIVTYYKKLVKTSWTYSMVNLARVSNTYYGRRDYKGFPRELSNFALPVFHNQIT